MPDNTFRNVEWHLLDHGESEITLERVPIAVLMDIRRELQRLNALLSCPNFTGIPETLRGIQRNTAQKPLKKKLKKATSERRSYLDPHRPI